MLQGEARTEKTVCSADRTGEVISVPCTPCSANSTASLSLAQQTATQPEAICFFAIVEHL